MNPQATARRWPGLPLALQIMALLLAGLLVAQGVTLALTLLLPPTPQRQWQLNDIARVLSGQAAQGQDAKLLQRTLQARAPEPKGQGWLTSERSRRELAQLLSRDEAEVRLYFFTPLPFAGTAGTAGTAGAVAQPGNAEPARPAPRRMARAMPSHGDGFLRVQAGGMPASPGGPGGFGGPGGAAFPGGPGGLTGGFGTGRGASGSIGASPPQQQQQTQQQSPPQAPAAVSTPGAGVAGLANAPTSSASPSGALTPGTPGSAATPATAASPAGPVGPAVPAGPTAAPGSPAAATAPGTAPQPAPMAQPPAMPGGPPANAGPRAEPPPAAPFAADRPVLRAPLEQPEPATPAPPAVRRPAVQPQPPRTEAAPRTAAPASAPTAPAASAPAPARAAEAARPPRSADTPRTPAQADASPSVERPAARGLFGLAPAPFVEGDFLAAVYTPEGSWVVVQPVPESFPNAWQRRVLLWFLLAAAIVVPAGWLFSRRLVRPIAGFARAADQLGRDPAAPVLALDGPAEIGRAAQAFNRMQARLRSFVDDRTVMIGAISHDLRTPLTRLRFRIEDVPDELRAGMLDDVEEMERMIGSVLGFIRDASVVSARERMDFASLVEDVVEQAVFVGKDVRLLRTEAAQVEVDAIGMRRVLDNLVENAVKYGQQARVRLFVDGADAVVEIADRGPGLPADELERVFKPFYRTAQARSSRAAGSGLGLAVCRSIARAHGGDVLLKPGSHGLLAQGAQGLLAQVRVPLALEPEAGAAARPLSLHT